MCRWNFLGDAYQTKRWRFGTQNRGVLEPRRCTSRNRDALEKGAEGNSIYTLNNASTKLRGILCQRVKNRENRSPPRNTARDPKRTRTLTPGTSHSKSMATVKSPAPTSVHPCTIVSPQSAAHKEDVSAIRDKIHPGWRENLNEFCIMVLSRESAI